MSTSNKYVSANCFWVKCINFLSCHRTTISENVSGTTEDFQQFTEDFQMSDDTWAFPMVFKRQQF